MPATAGPPSGRAASGVVLAVEDNPANLRLIEAVCELRPAIQLVKVTTGSAAADVAAARQPDLVLLDLRLPDVRGETVLAELKQRPETRDIPVVVLSADTSAADVLALGAVEYLTKPVDVRHLLEVIDRLLPPAG